LGPLEGHAELASPVRGQDGEVMRVLAVDAVQDGRERIDVPGHGPADEHAQKDGPGFHGNA
jgi:hypothetical protein